MKNHSISKMNCLKRGAGERRSKSYWGCQNYNDIDLPASLL
ncbi:unnamed protein product [Brassica oleracea var. botrytis]